MNIALNALIVVSLSIVLMYGYTAYLLFGGTA